MIVAAGRSQQGAGRIGGCPTRVFRFGTVDRVTAAAPLSDVFRVLDLTGVFTNAVLGAVIARTARLDLVGLTVIALISGLGGGVLRDTLLQHGTPIALTDYAYVLTALAAAAITFVVPFEGRVWNWSWPVIDAIALGSWAAAGAQKTLSRRARLVAGDPARHADRGRRRDDPRHRAAPGARGARRQHRSMPPARSPPVR